MKQILILQRLKLNAENNYRDQNMSFFMRTKDTIMYIYKTKKCFFFFINKMVILKYGLR